MVQPKQKVLCDVRLGDVLFYQNYISNRFSDGRGVNDTIHQLEQGTATPDTLPIMECLLHRGKLYGMGNRRLACYHYVFRRDPDRLIPVYLQDVSSEDCFLCQGNGVEVAVGGGLVLPGGRIVFSMVSSDPSKAKPGHSTSSNTFELQY